MEIGVVSTTDELLNHVLALHFQQQHDVREAHLKTLGGVQQ